MYVDLRDNKFSKAGCARLKAAMPKPRPGAQIVWNGIGSGVTTWNGKPLKPNFCCKHNTNAEC
jgi:hypothetical protein